MGLGLFGGGVGVARYFAARGDEVTVTDLASAERLAPSLALLADLPEIRYVLGRHDEQDVLGADLVVASPAVPPTAPLLARRRAAGLRITSEIELLLERIRGPVLAVTGSNGKTTTTTMLGRILKERGIEHRVGGNIGGSLLPEVESVATGTTFVLELSSFQLETIAITTRPVVGAILTNLAPNHLDRHGDMAGYRAAKLRLLDLMSAGAPLVLDAEDLGSEDLPAEARARGLEPLGLGAREIEATPMPRHMVGRFNRKNLAMASALAGRLYGADEAALARCAADIRGLPHRLEVLGRVGRLTVVNDSKATTPFATITALEALDRPVRLIAGGHDKGLVMDPLLEAFEGCERVLLCGATAAALERAHRARRGPNSPSVERVDDLAAALARATDDSDREAYVLFSPAHPSYDGWANYEERGAAFAAALRRIPGFEAPDDGL